MILQNLLVLLLFSSQIITASNGNEKDELPKKSESSKKAEPPKKSEPLKKEKLKPSKSKEKLIKLGGAASQSPSKSILKTDANSPVLRSYSSPQKKVTCDENATNPFSDLETEFEKLLDIDELADDIYLFVEKEKYFNQYLKRIRSELAKLQPNGLLEHINMIFRGFPIRFFTRLWLVLVVFINQANRLQHFCIDPNGVLSIPETNPLVVNLSTRGLNSLKHSQSIEANKLADQPCCSKTIDSTPISRRFLSSSAKQQVDAMINQLTMLIKRILTFPAGRLLSNFGNEMRNTKNGFSKKVSLSLIAEFGATNNNASYWQEIYSVMSFYMQASEKKMIESALERYILLERKLDYFNFFLGSIFNYLYSPVALRAVTIVKIILALFLENYSLMKK